MADLPVNRTLISPTSNPLLEQALRDKLQRRAEAAGGLGELEPLSLRLGLMQNTLKPRLREPQLLVVAGDHGLAVDGIAQPWSTAEQLRRLLGGRLPLAVFARLHGLALTAVDAGVAEPLPAHERLLVRKIAHGTRNARVNAAMSLDQAQAAMRAGMEFGDALRGNVVVCAGLGQGAHESAALIMSRLTGCSVRELVHAGPGMSSEALAHVMLVMQGAQGRHRDITDPIEVLAAFGGFEIAMLVGVMLVAAGKRHLIMVDGMAACAALMVACRLVPAVSDYCVFCRSNRHLGLDHALSLFGATALLELGMDSTDGSGAVLAWPLVRSAAALLTEVAEGEDPGPSRPAGISTAAMPLAASDKASV